VKPELHGKVLLPVLGDQHGRVLERGELQLRVENGALHLRYFDLDLPINPPQTPRVLGLHVDRLEQGMEGDPALREHSWHPDSPAKPSRVYERDRSHHRTAT
jgi:(1->4)-alpha-D-glucan 1-alpha-D-glucosylmutase